jgi:hypothetical protein
MATNRALREAGIELALDANERFAPATREALGSHG